MIDILKTKFGTKCSGIKINYEGTHVNIPLKKLRFCEALSYSYNVPLLLNGSNLTCTGAQRSLGLSADDTELISKIAVISHSSSAVVQKALQQIPVLKAAFENILLGIPEDMEEKIKPDLFIIQMKPQKAMELIREYTAKTDKFAITNPFTFLSVCGNVLIQTYLKKQVTLSLGCSGSRTFGKIGDNMVIVGIPYHISGILLN